VFIWINVFLHEIIVDDYRNLAIISRIVSNSLLPNIFPACKSCIEMRSPRSWRLRTATLLRWLPRVAQGGRLKMKTITLKIKGYHFEHNLWSWSIVLVFFAGDAHLARSVLHALLDLMEDTTACFVKNYLRANVCSTILRR